MTTDLVQKFGQKSIVTAVALDLMTAMHQIREDLEALHVDLVLLAGHSSLDMAELQQSGRHLVTDDKIDAGAVSGEYPSAVKSLVLSIHISLLEDFEEALPNFFSVL